MLYGAWLTFRPFDVPLLQSDSISYIQFSAIRTISYPALLRIPRLLGGDLGDIIHVQVWLYSAAVCFFGITFLHVLDRECGKHVNPTVLAGLTITTSSLLLLNPFVSRHHFMIMTESVFSSILIVVICFFLIALFLKRTLAVFCGLGVTIGALVTLKPSGYSLIAVAPVFLAIVYCESVVRIVPKLAAFAAGLLCIVALGQGLHAYVHGGNAVSLLDRHVFAKAAFAEIASDRNPFPESDPRHALWQGLEDDGARIRTLMRNAPNFGAKIYLNANYEVYFQHSYAQQAIADAAKKLGMSTYEVRKSIGLSRLFAAPADYLRLTARHYQRMWTLFAYRHPADAPDVKTYITSKEPLPFDGAGGHVTPDFHEVPSAIVLQPLFLAIGAMTVVALLAGFLSWLSGFRSGGLYDRALIASGFFSIIVHSHYVLVAMTGVGIPRYTFAMWPAIVVSVSLLLVCLLKTTLRGRKGEPFGVTTTP